MKRKLLLIALLIFVTACGTKTNTDEEKLSLPNFIGQDISYLIDWANAHDISVSGNDEISYGRSIASQDPAADTAIDDIDVINVTLKQSDTYDIVFNANGGTVDTLGKTVTLDQEYGDLPTPLLNGKTFAGWYTSLNGGTKVVPETIVTGYALLYAHWADIATITLDPNGGSVHTTSITTIDTLPRPKYEGYDFKGWWTQKTGGEQIIDASTISSDSILFAHWEIQVHEHDFSIDIPAVAPTCTTEGLSAGKKCLCGEIDPDNTPTTVPALGHDPQHVDTMFAEIYCTEPSREEGEICSRCGTIISGCEEFILGHFFRKNEDKKTETCIVCGFTQPIPPEG